MLKRHTFKYSESITESQLTLIQFGFVCFAAALITGIASIAYVFGH